MKSNYLWLPLFIILAACTCGGRTSECNNDHKTLSLLTNIHDDPACEVISRKGVIMYEAAKYIVDTYNLKNDYLKIDISIIDTCGSIAGTVKGTIKALVSAGLDCIHSPYYLGIIGPESPLNVDSMQKITSVLNIPHIVQAHFESSPYSHYLAKESEYYIVQGILEVIIALKWNSFSLITRKYYNDNHDDDIQVIAKKLTMAATARGLCVLIHDQDDIDNTISSHIVHIGIPKEDLINNLNGTILIASEGNIENYASKIKSTNAILLLEDSRNEFNELQSRIDNSMWWIDNQIDADRYDAEESRDVRWLKDAIGIYTKSLEILCKNKMCPSQVNPAEWNSILATVMSTYNAKSAITPKKLKLMLKRAHNNLKEIGEMSVLNNHSKFHWIDDDTDENPNSKEIVPKSFVDIISNTNDKKKIGCATADKTLRKLNNANNEDTLAQIFFTAFGNHEWWTMMAIVSGVGITMFTIGFIAVYIIYVNIRGPKSLENYRNGRRISRDVSLRQVSTPIHVNIRGPSSVPAPPTPQQSGGHYLSHRDSCRSISSYMSDKSIECQSRYW